MSREEAGEDAKEDKASAGEEDKEEEAMIALPIVDGILGVGTKLIDKLIPDPQAKAKAQLDLLKLEQSGELEDLKTRLTAIIAEAQSVDPWTSRARPSFLYVIYLMILASVPMGLLYAFAPEVAHNIATGMKEWLASIPDALWTLFGAGYLGYTGARSYDKRGMRK